MSKTMMMTVHPNGDHDIHHIGASVITLDHLRRASTYPHPYFEAVQCGPKLVMWIDEDGLAKGLPTNDHAIQFMERIALRSIRIVGPVIMTGPANADGDTMGISVNTMSDLVDIINL